VPLVLPMRKTPRGGEVMRNVLSVKDRLGLADLQNRKDSHRGAKARSDPSGDSDAYQGGNRSRRGRRSRSSAPELKKNQEVAGNDR